MTSIVMDSYYNSLEDKYKDKLRAQVFNSPTVHLVKPCSIWDIWRVCEKLLHLVYKVRKDEYKKFWLCRSIYTELLGLTEPEIILKKVSKHKNKYCKAFHIDLHSDPSPRLSFSKINFSQFGFEINKICDWSDQQFASDVVLSMPTRLHKITLVLCWYYR